MMRNTREPINSARIQVKQLADSIIQKMLEKFGE